MLCRLHLQCRIIESRLSIPGGRTVLQKLSNGHGVDAGQGYYTHHLQRAVSWHACFELLHWLFGGPQQHVMDNVLQLLLGEAGCQEVPFCRRIASLQTRLLHSGGQRDSRKTSGTLVVWRASHITCSPKIMWRQASGSKAWLSLILCCLQHSKCLQRGPCSQHAACCSIGLRSSKEISFLRGLACTTN